jgi:outer membrane protein assembly factor BamD (BamD/ComL family)
LEGAPDLGALAQANSALGERASSFGFSAKSDEANVFLVGALYSEALAFLRSGDFESAADRLEALQQQFIRLGVPNSLYGYVTKLLNLVSQQRYSNEALLDMLSLFQPFFEDYANGRSEDFMILFRAGSWLVDLSLAAAAGNTTMVRQQAHLEYIVREMKRMDAPVGVGEALEQIAEVTAKEEITTRDLQSMISQIKRIQSILG